MFYKLGTIFSAHYYAYFCRGMLLSEDVLVVHVVVEHIDELTVSQQFIPLDRTKSHHKSPLAGSIVYFPLY